jgi:hypothetical protein
LQLIFRRDADRYGARPVLTGAWDGNPCARLRIRGPEAGQYRLDPISLTSALRKDHQAATVIATTADHGLRRHYPAKRLEAVPYEDTA